MSKRAEELAKQLYPDPKLEDYDDILVYRADRDNALMGRSNVICVYEQAEKDLGWHRVEELLPPMNEEVIVLSNIAYGQVLDTPKHLCYAHIVDTKNCIDYEGWNIPGVKLWMPRPKLPIKNESENKV